jgi:hypothetical protein
MAYRSDAPDARSGSSRGPRNGLVTAALLTQLAFAGCTLGPAPAHASFAVEVANAGDEPIHIVANATDAAGAATMAFDVPGGQTARAGVAPPARKFTVQTTITSVGGPAMARLEDRLDLDRCDGRTVYAFTASASRGVSAGDARIRCEG